MDQDSIALLDDIREFDDVIEVEFRNGNDVRAICGLFAGYERTDEGAWYLILSSKATIRTTDLVSIRRRETIEA